MIRHLPGEGLYRCKFWMQLGTPGPENMPDARIDSDRMESRKTARICQNIYVR